MQMWSSIQKVRGGSLYADWLATIMNYLRPEIKKLDQAVKSAPEEQKEGIKSEREAERYAFKEEGRK